MSSITPLDTAAIERLRRHFTGPHWQAWISDGIAALCDLATSLQSEMAELWGVHNKTSFALFRTEEAARSYISGFPASVGGGLTISKIPVLG